MSSQEEWPIENERFLKEMSENCQKLSTKYYEIYNIFKYRESKFKLPIICIGSVIGMLSFGAEQFGQENSKFISIAVGCSSIVISIISSVEAYLKIGETMSKSLLVSTQLKKLKEKIDVELSIQPDDRVGDSTVFVRQCHTEYMDYLESAPPIHLEKILNQAKKLQIGSSPTTPVTASNTHNHNRDIFIDTP